MTIESIDIARPPSRKRKRAKPPTATQRQKQRLQAVMLCQGATTDASRAVADRMAMAWTDCGCDELLGETEVLQPDILNK